MSKNSFSHGDNRDLNGNEIPADIGLEHNHTNEVIYSPNYGVINESNVSERPYYMSGPSKEDSVFQANDTLNVKDIKREYGSTGAFDEYTATQEEGVSKSSLYEGTSNQKITNMNVEGMPWFYNEPEADELRKRQNTPVLSKKETRQFIYSSVLAALMIAGVFIGGFFLFLLFVTKIWF